MAMSRAKPWQVALRDQTAQRLPGHTLIDWCTSRQGDPLLMRALAWGQIRGHDLVLT